MLAFGALLTCAAVLALAVLIVVLRGPNPPPWITGHWAQEFATVVIVCSLTFGPASVAAGALRVYQVGPNFLDLGLFAAVLFAAAWIWRRFDQRRRAWASDTRAAATAASDARPATSEPPYAAKPAPRAA